MAGAINALKKGELQRALGAVNRELVSRTRVATGADSDAMLAGARYFREQWRELLGRKSNRPSAPGGVPAKRAGTLQRSIGTAVVEGVRRVGSSSHVARLLQSGVNAQAKGARLSLKGRRHGRKAIATRGSTYRIVIAPRPHAEVALARAQTGMVDVTVHTLQKKIAGGAVS